MNLELKKKISDAKPETPVLSLCLYDYYGGQATRIEKVLIAYKVKRFYHLVSFVESYGGIRRMKAELKGLGSKGADVLDQIVRLYKKNLS